MDTIPTGSLPGCAEAYSEPPGGAQSRSRTLKKRSASTSKHRIAKNRSAPRRRTIAACPGCSAVDHGGSAARSRPPGLAFRRSDRKESNTELHHGKRTQKFGETEVEMVCEQLVSDCRNPAETSGSFSLLRTTNWHARILPCRVTVVIRSSRNRFRAIDSREADFRVRKSAPNPCSLLRAPSSWRPRDHSLRILLRNYLISPPFAVSSQLQRLGMLRI
jgi:hypothetical protein